MTVQERIEKSEVYRFYVRNPKNLDGTGLTAFQLVEALANAKIVSKRAKGISMVCKYLKAKYNVLCDDGYLRKVVEKAYDKVAYYERRDYSSDYNDLSSLLSPWYQCHFQKRMHGYDFSDF